MVLMLFIGFWKKPSILFSLISSDSVFADGKKFISALDAEGGTALHWAVLAHNLPTVQFLMEKGCSVDFKQTKVCFPLVA